MKYLQSKMDVLLRKVQQLHAGTLPSILPTGSVDLEAAMMEAQRDANDSLRRLQLRNQRGFQ